MWSQYTLLTHMQASPLGLLSTEITSRYFIPWARILSLNYVNLHSTVKATWTWTGQDFLTFHNLHSIRLRYSWQIMRNVHCRVWPSLFKHSGHRNNLTNQVRGLWTYLYYNKTVLKFTSSYELLTHIRGTVVLKCQSTNIQQPFEVMSN